jgi:hypothetical protein
LLAAAAGLMGRAASPAGAPVGELLGVAAELARLGRLVGAWEGRLVALAKASRDAAGGDGWTAVEEHALGAALTSWQAREVERAGRAGLEYDQVGSAQDRGEMPGRSCLAVWAAAGRVQDGQAKAEVVGFGVRLAAQFDWKRVQGGVDRLAAKLDPAAMSKGAAQGRADRSVRYSAKPFGMAELRAYGPAGPLGLVMASIEAAGRKAAAEDRQARQRANQHHTAHNPDQPGQGQAVAAGRADQFCRTQAQREFDALCQAFGPAGQAEPPATQAALAATPHMLVAVDAATLAGLAEAPGLILGAAGGGGAPICWEDSLRLAFQATWQVALTQAGRLAALCPDIHQPATWPAHLLASAGYQPSQTLKAATAAKHQACVRCGAPINRCETDHTTPWPQGQTNGLNLQPLCKRCHQLKTHHGWQYHHNPATGATTIKTPTGHHTRIPPPLLQ